jgi:hypothetical protein
MKRRRDWHIPMPLWLVSAFITAAILHTLFVHLQQ